MLDIESVHIIVALMKISLFHPRLLPTFVVDKVVRPTLSTVHLWIRPELCLYDLGG